MNETRQELLEIVHQVNAHLVYQQALGVRVLEVSVARGMDSRNAGRTAAEQVSPAGSTGAVPAPSSVSSLDEIRREIGDCTRCKLFKGRNTIVFGEGNPSAALVFVGEGPGFDEDQQGRPFVGAAGQLLTDIIVKGMKLKREDVYICNIVKCRPPGNRNPEPDEVEACIGFVKKQIAAIKPKVIVTLGNVPTQCLLGTKQGITKMRGVWQEYDGILVMPTFHPSYLLRSPGEKKRVWEDIKLVMGKLGMTVPEK
ncbi:MAG TPA: uracil-DNA glycosylase [Nitrospirota bacterium]